MVWEGVGELRSRWVGGGLLRRCLFPLLRGCGTEDADIGNSPHLRSKAHDLPPPGDDQAEAADRT